MDLQTTGYVLYRDTNFTVETDGPTEGFTTTEPADMVICEGFRSARIILLGAPVSATATIAAVEIYGVDTLRPSRERTLGWFQTLIATTGLVTFNGAITATTGRAIVLSAPSALASFAEDASFTPRRTYATLSAGLGAPAPGVAPWFELLIPDLANLHAIRIFPSGTWGAAMTNFNAYVALDL